MIENPTPTHTEKYVTTPHGLYPKKHGHSINKHISVLVWGRAAIHTDTTGYAYPVYPTVSHYFRIKK